MGFDNECILNIQSLAGEYFCPVCRLLVYPNEALQSQCTHLYCKPCLTYVVSTTRACPYDGYLVTEADSKPLIESNKTLAETIGKIEVHCLYHRSGCTWQGPLSECTSHCTGCAFGNSPVVCNRCGIQIVHRQVQEHAQNCPGVQPQVQQAEGAQDTSATGGTATADQTQTTQAGATTPQTQTSQTTAAATPGQDPNQQVNPNSQAQAAVQAAVPTPEQWYQQQQQQQYQQYYQQYPGYDPYQQHYQHYNPYQQPAVPQYQQQQHLQAPPHVTGQHQPQAYMQPQPQSQPQLQPQPHVQPQAQHQAQLQPQPQPQPHGQSQAHPHVQTPVVAPPQNQAQVNLQQQFQPAVQPHSQIQSQTHPPAPGHPPPQAQLYPQAQPHPTQATQPHPQQHVPMPQYQMQNPQLQIQQQANHQPVSLSQPHSQAQQQAPVQHHPQPYPQLHPPQPNQPLNPNVQPQMQHPSAHAVTGHHSYPQSQHNQQIQLVATQHPMHMHPQGGSQPQSQHPGQIPSQFPKQPPVRPSHSHATILNQQQPGLLPSPGQVQNVPSAQQQPAHSHAQQPGHPIHQRPVMQAQQPMAQQYVQHQQSFVQQGPFLQLQMPTLSQIRPQGPPHSYPQHSHAFPQPLQNVALSQGSQNVAGRPIMPNHGVQSQPYPQYSGGVQTRPLHPGASQPSANQNNMLRNNNQVQLSSEQPSGATSRPTMSKKQGDQIFEKSVVDQAADSYSENATKKVANDMDAASGLGADAGEVKTVKSENDMKSVGDGDADPESNAVENGEPVLKRMVKEEASEVVDEIKEDVPNVGPKQLENFAVEDKEIQDGALLKKSPSQQTENFEKLSGKLQKDATGALQPSTGTDEGSQAVSSTSAPISGSPALNCIPRGTVPQGPGLDECRGFPPPSQGQSGAFRQPSHPFPIADQGRHLGPSTLQQRPGAPSMLQTPPPIPPHHAQAPAPTQFRPQGHGHVPEHFPSMFKQSQGLEIPPVGISGPGSMASFGRGPGNYGLPRPNFESHPQGPHSQGHALPPPPGIPRMSQGEPIGGLPFGALPPGAIDSHGGMMARAPAHGPEGLMGQQRPTNMMEAELYLNQKPSYMDGRRPDPHLPGSLGQGPLGQPSGMMRSNGPPGLDSSTLGSRDERFKPFSDERSNSFPVDQRTIDRGEFEDDLKQFPRPSRSDAEPVPKFGSYSLRPHDRGPPGLNFDGGLKLGPGAGSAHSRFLPPFDAGERPFGFPEDTVGRSDSSRSHPDFLGPVAGYGRRHMDGLTPRSPVREYPGISSRNFGGLPGQSGLDDIDGRESRRFGDPIGNSFHESRFPILPSHLRRGEFEGPGNLRMGEHLRGGDLIGLDSHLRRGEHLGPRNLPSHLRSGEPIGFGAYPGHARMGELAGPGSFETFGAGNRPSHPRLGEPGFRSSFSLQGFTNDGGIYTGDVESFDHLRKRKAPSMGWCRICKVDCETVEGLDLHSQTREHQKKAMDMVVSIKQNAKKQKLTSGDHSSLEDASKSRNVSSEARGNKH